MIITGRFQFRASHSLEAPDHRKQEIGDLCGVLHGHEYLVEVSLSAKAPDPVTGLSPARSWLAHLNDAVFAPLRNCHLNDHFAFTSGEYVCQSLFERCQRALPDADVLKVAIQETAKNRFEVKRLAY